MGKILERAIMFFYVQTILPSIGENQFAYQKGRSTVDAVISAIDSWTKILDETPSQFITSVFIDMSKAFDRMDRGKLLDMLVERGLNSRVIDIINSFLENREQTTRLSTTSSTSRVVLNGTPQGTILGPMFWLLYIDSLEVPCDVIKYADDLTLIGKTTGDQQNSMQISIDMVEEWCSEHNMIANASKSYTMNICNKFSKVKKVQSSNLTLGKQEIPQVTTTKFLGVNIDDHLSFEQHVNQIGKRVRPKTFVLLKLKRSGFPQDILSKYYLTCIRPQLTYACAAWFPMITKEASDRLTKLENLALKIICPSSDSYEDRLATLQITPLMTFMKKICADYAHKIENPKHCLHKLLQPMPTNQRRSKRLKQRKSDTKCNTALRGNTLLMKYTNLDCISYKE